MSILISYLLLQCQELSLHRVCIQVFLGWVKRRRRFICSRSQAVCACETVLTSISKPKEPTGAKPQLCLQVDYCCCHKRQYLDCLFTTYQPSVLILCLDMNTNTHTQLDFYHVRGHYRNKQQFHRDFVLTIIIITIPWVLILSWSNSHCWDFLLQHNLRCYVVDVNETQINK